jgi:UDP-N-acetylglucosamine:LPS N-acetylglucosamine transferase
LAQELKILQGMIRLGHKLLVDALRQHWLKTEPDLVVSLVPNFNRALYEGLAIALPGVPFVTILTDLADYPPQFWIEEGQRQDFVCGTPHAVRQARAAGHPERRVHAVSGMVLRPEFYGLPPRNRAEERRRLGLDTDRPTGLVMFGGQGSSTMLRLAALLPDTQLVFLCGHNARLAQRLRALPAPAPRCVVGFTPDVPRYMQLSDFFIGKPGPGSLSEAVHMKLPVIVSRNASTMPQERYNAVWVRDNGVGIVLPGFRAVRPAVAELVAGLDTFRAATERLSNRAVFEIVDVLERVLARSVEPTAPLAAALLGD